MKEKLKKQIKVKDNFIGVMKVRDMDYISLTDLARYVDSEEPRLPIRYSIKSAVDTLKAAGFNAESHISDGTGHEFLTWRRALRQMALSLFK